MFPYKTFLNDGYHTRLVLIVARFSIINGLRIYLCSKCSVSMGGKTTGLFETLKKTLKDYLEAKKLNLWECLFILDLTELLLFEICEEILSRIMK